MSAVLKVCTSPRISKRNTACVPPRYFPFNTRPSFSSKVSAAAAPTKNSPSATAAKKRFTLFIVPSRDRKSSFLRIPAFVPSTQRQPYNSTALDDGNPANGCARHTSWQRRVIGGQPALGVAPLQYRRKRNDKGPNR